MITDALIRHRDGIVGTWAGKAFTAPQLPLESVSTLERWEPWVRAALFDDELLMHLDPRAAWARCWPG